MTAFEAAEIERAIDAEVENGVKFLILAYSVIGFIVGFIVGTANEIAEQSKGKPLSSIASDKAAKDKIFEERSKSFRLARTMPVPKSKPRAAEPPRPPDSR